MEPQVINQLPDFKMMDYKVNYLNHKQFQDGTIIWLFIINSICDKLSFLGEKGRKQGSPVRIFTNVPLESLPLPKEEGYSFCKFCKKWKSKENVHCLECGICTSKVTHFHLLAIAFRAKDWCIFRTVERMSIANSATVALNQLGSIAWNAIGVLWKSIPVRNSACLRSQVKAEKAVNEKIALKATPLPLLRARRRRKFIQDSWKVPSPSGL